MRLLPGLLVGLLAALASIHASGETALVEQRFFENKVKILVPTDFTQMTEEVLRLKYPTDNRPTLALSNDEASITVNLNHTNSAVQPSQITEAHKQVDQAFHNLYPSAEWFRSEVTDINGKVFFILDLRTPAIDTEVRNIIVGTSLDNRLLIVSFNCTKEEEIMWVPTGQRIINSIVVGE